MVNTVFMKKLFLILLAVIPIVAIAQEPSYDSLLDGEKLWTVKIESFGFNDKYVSYVEYKLMDMTSIDGISYRQLFTRHKGEDEDEWSEWKLGEFGGLTYIGEDSDGKVYYYGSYRENFVTMDFSLQVGDVYQFNYDYDVLPYVVTAVSDTILENSFDRKPRKCIYLAHYLNGEVLSEEWHRDIWIEGIGSMKYGLMGMNGELTSGSHLLMKCTQQGNIIYQYDNATAVQDIKQLFIDETPTYNLAGQKVNPSYKGIVIQNGKIRIGSRGLH